MEQCERLDLEFLYYVSNGPAPHFESKKINNWGKLDNLVSRNPHTPTEGKKKLGHKFFLLKTRV